MASHVICISHASGAGGEEVQHGLEPQAAARAVKDSDAGRRDYLRRFYDVDEELATQYDLVVNTDAISVDAAASVIVHAATA